RTLRAVADPELQRAPPIIAHQLHSRSDGIFRPEGWRLPRAPDFLDAFDKPLPVRIVAVGGLHEVAQLALRRVVGRPYGSIPEPSSVLLGLRVVDPDVRPGSEGRRIAARS